MEVVRQSPETAGEISAFIAAEEEQFNWLIIARMPRVKWNLRGDGLLTLAAPAAAASAAAAAGRRRSRGDASRENVANLKRQDCCRDRGVP